MISTKKLSGKSILTSWQFSVATASLVLGFLLSVQFKSQAEYRKNTAIPSRRIEDITNLLKESEEKRQSLEKSLLELRSELDEIKKNNGSLNSISDSVLTGSLPVLGAGIIVTLNDSKKPLENGENPANGIVHNEDLLKIANELKSSGAEAISINGNRLISTSEISCAGPTILINKNRVTPPFEIKAIGNAETMIAAIEMRGGILETIKFFGLESKIERKNEVKVPAYNGSIAFKYSKPIRLDPEKEDN